MVLTPEQFGILDDLMRGKLISHWRYEYADQLNSIGLVDRSGGNYEITHAGIDAYNNNLPEPGRKYTTARVLDLIAKLKKFPQNPHLSETSLMLEMLEELIVERQNFNNRVIDAENSQALADAALDNISRLNEFGNQHFLERTAERDWYRHQLVTLISWIEDELKILDKATWGTSDDFHAGRLSGEKDVFEWVYSKTMQIFNGKLDG